MPVVATGLAGGLTGTRIVEELTGEAILNDFVRIADESRTSTAVVDPTSSTLHRDQRVGPARRAGGAGDAPREAALPRDARPTSSSSRARSRAASRTTSTATLIRELNKRSIKTVLDAEGEPLRMGTAAEPFLVSPNQREAESLVGQEFHEDQDFIQALDDIAELGARNVLITQESGCFALLREEREVKRLRAVAPEVEPASTVGSGDVLLSAFLAARDAGKPIDEALRSAVAAGRGVDARSRRRPVRPARGEPTRGSRRGNRARTGRLLRLVRSTAT